jgi:excinuclease ABC subunit C
MSMSLLREQAASLPVVPGVYLFKNAEGEILYVGKAIRLRERVRSYFAKDIGRGPGIEQMVREATQLDHQTTASEMEALLLEARLIRQYKPRYNIKLRDDKSFALIRIDLSEAYPGIYISREKELEELLVRKKRDRADISKVSQKIDQQEFFGPYLSAAAVRGALKTIRKIWPFRDCGPAKYATYQKLEHGCIFATLHLCSAPCALKISPESYRKDIDQIREFLRGERESVVKNIHKEMERAALEERYEDAATYRNRMQSLLHIQNVAASRRTIHAQKTGKHVYNPEEDLKVECYDISNNQGSYAVGSEIAGVIQRGKLEPISTREEVKARFYLDNSQYRKFRIKTVEGIADTEMLKEVLSRRMRRAKSDDPAWALPDLIVVDGGKGQLSAAQSVRTELGLDGVALIGAVAKGPTRKRVDLHGPDWMKVEGVSEEAWTAIAELLREEAHRFAITYYRNLHRKNMLMSSTSGRKGTKNPPKIAG